MIKGHIDVLMISESNLDNSVPDEQFLIEGYGTPFRLDRNKLGVVSCFFFRNDIPAKLLSLGIGFKNFFLGLNF